MDFFYLVLALVSIAYAVFIFMLQLKMWDMCNDIKTLTSAFIIKNYKAGMTVERVKDNEQMEIDKIEGITIYCHTIGSAHSYPYSVKEIRIKD